MAPVPERPRPRTLRTAVLLGSAALVLAAATVWFSGSRPSDSRDERVPVRVETGNPGAIGTSGQERDDDRREAADVIRELETMTGVNDGHQFVGRRVDLRVPISRHLNDVAFWAGVGDNRLLVVLARDNRDQAARQKGEPSTPVGLVPEGQQAVVSGTIQRVPYAEAMYSWGLTDADRSELMARRIYLRADTVSPASADAAR